MEEITVEHLTNEADSKHTYFTQFSLAYDSTSNEKYSFFEGNEDPQYYSSRIKSYGKVPDNLYRFFICNGKENLLNTYYMIIKHDEYDLNRILLFIDKDYSKRIEIEDIYCTPGYSVENFYTDKQVFINILREGFGLNDNCYANNDYDKALELYEKYLNKFHKSTLYINSWLACHDDMRINKKNKAQLCIDDKLRRFFSNIVNENLNGISDFSELMDINKIENLFETVEKVNINTFNIKLNKFKNIQGAKFFRGKFELKFLISFLDKLKKELGKKDSNIFSKRYKISLRFEYSSAISDLSSYASTPKCLIEYLKKYNGT